MNTATETVFVVDDDLSVREALSSLIRSVGFHVQTFSSAVEFLQQPRPAGVSCLVLDVRMPGLSGLDLQGEFAKSGDPIPIIFITGHGDIPMAVRAIKAGAVEFLAKPFRDDDLLEAIRHALERDRAGRSEAAELDEIRRKYATLTGREREVIALMVKGMLNKQAAAELGVAEITVKVHRHNIMQKMKVRSLPDLVRMMEKVNAR
ncbi:MAG TPA: response regulator transcription factor [Zoogloea sp.]|uniref:response regulator transcription factor n=1 Tax=Zoogloea sp. TaxID=49181 RepID=UPI002D09BB02|nr:response regulator transcription factor [Zoogloea sp.]HOB45278.1 response regulator transcription factor [Zoogloea sp.]HQA10143.1 response regulator transcription factor [Zoogloea sp.]HQE38302.1 response regulator transcription factor [Zoogloea sp.]